MDSVAESTSTSLSVAGSRRHTACRAHTTGRDANRWNEAMGSTYAIHTITVSRPLLATDKRSRRLCCCGWRPIQGRMRSLETNSDDSFARCGGGLIGPCGQRTERGLCDGRSGVPGSGRRSDLCSSPPAGARHTRLLSGQPTPRREQIEIRPSSLPGHHFSRCPMTRRSWPNDLVLVDEDGVYAFDVVFQIRQQYAFGTAESRLEIGL